MLIDTHAHLNFSAFKDDVNEIIKRTLENDVWVINVGSQYSTSKRAVEIAQKYEEEVYLHTNGALCSAQISKCAPSGVGVYAAVGLHPVHLEERKVDHSEVDARAVFKTRSEEFDYEKYKELAQNPKVVAIGEIGLDYWYKPKTKKKLEEFKERQRGVFLKQLNLAKELNLPIILHCRIAHDDLLRLLELQASKSELGGVIHCFTGDWQQAQKYLDLGFYLGFNGLIFKKIEGAPDWQGIIKKLPLEKILIETDAPYLTPPLPAEVLAEAGPEPIRNEPFYVKYVAQKIAEIKNLTFEEIVKITTQNAKELFRI